MNRHALPLSLVTGLASMLLAEAPDPRCSDEGS
jgi:hypothetical protein